MTGNVDGRVGTLLIEAENPRPSSEGSKSSDEMGSRDVTDDDPLDDLAEVVLRQKGTVVVIPTEQMPTNTGLAAIFRF